jgi:putative ABC transport system substrate-binding protein
MRRREFVGFLGGTGLVSRIALAQQHEGKLPTVGFLGPAITAIAAERTAAFERRLRELGWQDRRTIALEYRWAEGRAERFGQIAGSCATMSM